MSQLDQARAVYIEEAREHLAELESTLLQLEQEPGGQDLIDRAFRAIHTIKGSGAMFGFDAISAFTHEVESVLDRVRSGALPVTKSLLDLTLRAGDQIQAMLDLPDSQEEAGDQSEIQAVLAGMRALLQAGEPDGGDAPAPAPAPSSVPGQAARPERADEDGHEVRTVRRIRFRPGRDIFLTGTNPLLLVEELCGLGQARVVAHTQDVPPLAEIDPEACYTWWDIVLSSTATDDAIRDVFIFVDDSCALEIQVIDSDGMAAGADPAYKRLGEILVEKGDAPPEAIQEVLEQQKPLGELLVEAGKLSRTRLDAALAEQATVRETRSARQRQDADASTSIRVAADKLDRLVDLVGELVIAQSRLSQIAYDLKDGVLSSIAEEVERLSNDLRDSTLGIRMLPIGTTFTKFKRMVRDLSSELGKEIELVTRGGETELDKTVIEKLGDPLVHLLRNSIDHGIETPEDRAAVGKERQGTVTLSAEHVGGEVVIRVADDGRGLDPARIRAKAVEKGLIAPDAELTEKEILNLVFAPGFSTASSVTSVSGRGVGMDVVKKSIDSLRGDIDIRSTPGQGSEIVVKLPLTLAIIDGLQVQTGGEHYVLPLSTVEECVELAGRGGERTRIVDLRGEAVPYVRLRDFFGIAGTPPSIEHVVVATVGGERLGIVVDQVVGEHQTVIKSLGHLYRDVQGISGATVRGDGSMALIVDIPGLLSAVLSGGAAAR